MTKSLVIVESPAKAKTINKYLGNNYIVKSSIGHIRDLPKGGTAKKGKTATKSKDAKAKAVKPSKEMQLFNRMGINPTKNWEARYEILPGKEKVVAELKKLAQESDTIYLATDLDREGEAIAWHLQQVIGGDESRYKRVVFNEITQKAITEAFKQPSDIVMPKVEAQQARRFLDRVVGFMVSPLLWAKIARGLSAGRVQSVAVRLLVEREREIKAFIPIEYWEVDANLKNTNGAFVSQLVKYQSKKIEIKNQEEVNQVLAALQPADFVVTEKEEKPTFLKPNAPFITSTLQQSASTKMGFSVKKTMTMAQRLYEAGYITYMRTDSTNISADALDQARNYIGANYGSKYLPKQANIYSSKQNAQEAHEAIRPSSVNVLPKDLRGVDADAIKLYDLIWRQFVACQMTKAEFLATKILIEAEDYEFKTTDRRLLFDGFTKVMPLASKGDETQIPQVEVGEVLNLVELQPSQHFTKAPPRFSEAALVKEMEKRGIGRPSTYASIISTIQDRGYVVLENRRFYAQKMGEIVTDRLVESFKDLMDYDFTAHLEDNLDAIANNKLNWLNVLNDFYKDFTKNLSAAEKPDGMRGNTPASVSIKCPTCGKNMQVRTASTGVFLGCSGYALPPKERCKQTMSLVSDDEYLSVDADETDETKALMTKKRCPICRKATDGYIIDERTKIHICSDNPDCEGYILEKGNFKLKGYDGPTLQCDKCSSEMQLKDGRFGKYFACTNPECKNTRKLLRSGEPAPPKADPIAFPELKCQKVDDFYLLRDGASGIFLAASKFPKNRETRAPLVKELLPHQAELEEKFQYLLKAPVADKEGNPTVIRFSRKLKQQYVQAEKNGKSTGFSAYYNSVKKQWEVSGK